MKKLISISILSTALALMAVANDYHSHSPHKCHRNLATHGQCEHGKNKGNNTAFQGPDGVDYEGCICFWSDCGWSPNNWVSWGSFKDYLRSKV
jgi:hypothetical protein